MAPKRITHTHTCLELVMLKAALGKYADKMNAAVTALRAAGEGELADKEATDLRALVGDVGDRGREHAQGPLRRAAPARGQEAGRGGAAGAHAVSSGPRWFPGEGGSGCQIAERLGMPPRRGCARGTVVGAHSPPDD